ncbi:hypothetical protein JXB28_01190 [Candidatus Woesearchaeota archaeon]|nr:hypothetical protein [Candidatus Woesearchaeota archaeon]
MGLEKLLKHAVIGAAAVWVADKPLEGYLSKKTNLSKEEKSKYKTLAKGSILGAVTGDYIGEEINNGNKYSMNERVQNIGLGAIAGAVGTYLIMNGKHRKNGQAQAASPGGGSNGDGSSDSPEDGDGAPGDFEPI